MRQYWGKLAAGVFLAVLGYGLYSNLGPVERWRIPWEEHTWFGFSPDGRYILSSVSQGFLRKRDAATGAILTDAFRTKPVEIHSLDAPHGHWPRYVAALFSDDRAAFGLWDLQTDETKHIPIDDPCEGSRSVFVSPRDDMAAIFHHEDAREDAPRPQHPAEVRLIALPGGEKLATFALFEPRFFRQQFLDFTATFSLEGAHFLFATINNGTPQLRLWDIRARKPAGVILFGGKPYIASPNGRFLLIGDLTDKLQQLWDLIDPHQPKMVSELPGPGGSQFSSDSRLVLRELKNEVLFWDCATGMGPRRLPLAKKAFENSFAFSRDGKLMAMEQGLLESCELAILDSTTLTKLWGASRAGGWKPAFAGWPDPGQAHANEFRDDAEVHVFAGYQGEKLDVEIRRSTSGELLGTIPLSSPYRWHLARNGLRAAIATLRTGNEPLVFENIRGWLDWLPFRIPRRENTFITQVIDLPTAREVFRVEDSEEFPAFGTLEAAPWLSADGSAILTFHAKVGHPHVRCYDIPARRPWLAIIGIPAGLGLLLFLAAWVRERRRRLAVSRSA